VPNWKTVLDEITQHKTTHEKRAIQSADIVRRRYLKKLQQYTGRNVIAYYSGFLAKPSNLPLQIADEDKNGLMMAIHNLDRTKGLDLILHTPGGNMAATESMVDYLRKMFGKDIRAVVPQIAMSAGTIIACCCKRILMAKHSNLGPIDPQIDGLACFEVIKEFDRAYLEMKTDPASAHRWRPILSQYRPTFLGQCQNAIDWANDFVTEQLRDCMFEGLPDAAEKAKEAVERLTVGNMSHSRHIHAEQCKAIGLVIEDIESDQELQDLILTVHHCYMHALTNTNAFKMIENHLGAAFVKQAVIQAIQAIN